MKTITLWSVAMSAFFSLSITGSLYGAGRDHLQAAAGNPAGVERTLGDLAGRMGLGALPPAEIPAADRVQVANRAPDQDFARAIIWVQREGRSVTDSGRPVAIHPQLAALFGMEPVAWPAKQKAFGPTDRPDVTCLFQVAELNGRRELVMTYIEGKARIFWRVDQDGRVLATVYVILGDAPARVPNERHADLMSRMLEVLLDAMPPSRVDR